MLANSHVYRTEMYVSGPSITFSVTVSQSFMLTNALILATTLAEKWNSFSFIDANADEEERD